MEKEKRVTRLIVMERALKERLDRVVPGRQRNQVICDLIKDYLDKLEGVTKDEKDGR